MKKLMILFVALSSLVGTMPGFAASPQCAYGEQQRKNRSIMDLPPFNRAILILKHYESMHHPKDYPYVGYGHRVLPGEPYYRGIQLTDAQADALLRKDLKKFVALYDHLPKYKLLLGVLAYNIGPGAVNKSSVYKKLSRGDTNIYKEYVSHCHYKGKWHRQLNERRRMEYHLLFNP